MFWGEMCLNFIYFQSDAKVVQNKVAKLKKLMRWDGEELLAWEDLHNRKEEDIYLLQQFINEDTAQFKASCVILLLLAWVSSCTNVANKYKFSQYRIWR